MGLGIGIGCGWELKEVGRVWVQGVKLKSVSLALIWYNSGVPLVVLPGVNQRLCVSNLYTIPQVPCTYLNVATLTSTYMHRTYVRTCIHRYYICFFVTYRNMQWRVDNISCVDSYFFLKGLISSVLKTSGCVKVG